MGNLRRAWGPQRFCALCAIVWSIAGEIAAGPVRCLRGDGAARGSSSSALRSEKQAQGKPRQTRSCPRRPPPTRPARTFGSFAQRGTRFASDNAGVVPTMRPPTLVQTRCGPAEVRGKTFRQYSRGTELGHRKNRPPPCPIETVGARLEQLQVSDRKMTARDWTKAARACEESSGIHSAKAIRPDNPPILLVQLQLVSAL